MMSKIVLSFVFTMLCQGLHVDIKNMCPRSDKFCVKVKLNPSESYELDRNVTYPHQKVTFSGSRVYAIPGHFFFVFPNVRFLTMNRCNVRNLEEADFMGAENLVRLEMWKNQIRELPRDLFSGCRNLEWLDLSSNQIKTLHPHSFHGLRRLRKLLLFRNQIHTLPPILFRDLVALETVHLEDNMIEILEENIFIANSRLGIVRIRNNRLKVVHPSIFLSMRNLYWLDLSRNYFDEIQTNTLDTLHINDGMVKKCFINGKIRNLHADNNEIQSLYIRDLTNTQEIHISRNKLYDLSSIHGAKHLSKLDASQNKLGLLNSLDFSQMADLMYLNLSNTDLILPGKNAFARLTNLATLDLSHNQMRELPADLLTPLRNLRELHLDYNKLTQVNYSNLRDSSPALKYLGLHGNNWRCSYLRDLVEYMDRNGISVSKGIYDDSVGGTHNVAGINCTLL